MDNLPKLTPGDEKNHLANKLLPATNSGTGSRDVPALAAPHPDHGLDGEVALSSHFMTPTTPRFRPERKKRRGLAHLVALAVVDR